MKKEHVLGLLGICAVVLVLSFAGLISDFVTRLIGNIDGLLLLFICLMMLGLFAGMLYAMGKEEGWLPGHRSSSNPGPGEGK
jgi:4-amino-4-deoxy-L-arabinose transferase-like glycosyltransferase